MKGLPRKHAERWKRFRRLRGLVGGTLDIKFEASPNHPNPINQEDAHLRGTLKKIFWCRREVNKPLPSTFQLTNIRIYVPGTRSWRPWSKEQDIAYCGFGGGPIPMETKNHYYFLMAAMVSAIFIPKGVSVPARHLLYQTRKQREKTEKTFKKILVDIQKNGIGNM